MRVLVYIWASVVLLSCSGKPIDNAMKEEVVLEEIVYLRTEGLMLLEKLVDHCPSDDECMMGAKVLNFYSETQPSLVGLCENKKLNLSLSTYEEISNEVEKLLQDSSSYYEFLLEKLLTNLHNQKDIYLRILQDKELESLHYYTLDSYLQMVCFIEDYKNMITKTYMLN